MRGLAGKSREIDQWTWWGEEFLETKGITKPRGKYQCNWRLCAFIRDHSVLGCVPDCISRRSNTMLERYAPQIQDKILQ